MSNPIIEAAITSVAKSSPGGVIFRQVADPVSSTYTYLLGCATTKKALIIDPVLEQAARDAKLVEDLGAYV